MQQDLLTRLDQALQGIYGAGAHTDWGVLTILATDENPGLQVFSQGKWAHVKPVPGTFVINLGDMLERCCPHVVARTVCVACSLHVHMLPALLQSTFMYASSVLAVCH